jgi:hypothetical protein
LDAKKAFDSVDHEFIIKVLIKFGIKNEFIKIFKLLYNNLTAKVLVNGFFTDKFQIQRSVKQGDALSCVLFILCMETVTAAINQSEVVTPILMNDLRVPKVLAYADDIAILTSSPVSISKSIEIYNSFSLVSGLYLNVDKTEILRLDRLTNEDINIMVESGNYSIPTVSQLTICGRTFANDDGLEYENNVTNKINKLKMALGCWTGRSLSIFGRCLILKTFGLSQLIYSMQNSFFNQIDIKNIERICFNFLWNKKANKCKAYERIARHKLKLPNAAGGIKAPDIESLDLGLKTSQLIRSTNDSTLHFISLLQCHLYNINPDNLFQPSCTNSFVNRASQGMCKLGDLAVQEILTADTDSRLNKVYYNLIASESLTILSNKYLNNPIARNMVKQLQKITGISQAGQLINEFKYPSSDKAFILASNIVRACPLFTKISERKILICDTSFRDGLPVDCNKILSANNITSKAIKNRLFLGNNTIETIEEFNCLKLITHPKERELLFFEIHKVVLSNEKLNSMKLISSPLCRQCQVVQDSQHIFETCHNAVTAFEAILKFPEINNRNYLLSINVESLIKRLLFLNKDKEISGALFEYAISCRINDFKILQARINNHKLVDKSKKIVLGLNMPS